MVRSPSKVGLNQGAWTAHEDLILSDYINTHGQGRWKSLPTKAGLNRCGKSCRLRWLNYLRPNIKRGNISSDEEELIVKLHRLLGNRWSLIAGRLPGRTDNEIKNYWNTRLRKKDGTCEKEISESTSKKGPSKSSRENDDNIVRPTPLRTKAQVAVTNVNIDAVSNHRLDEEIRKSSLCLFSSLPDQQLPHSEYSQDNGVSQNNLNLNQLSHIECDMFGELCSGPKTYTNSFTFDTGADGLSEIYDNSEQIDWINELEYQ